MIHTIDTLEICVKLKMDAAHRIYGHESKCKDIHGHEYRFEVYCRAADIDELDRVIDFSVVKHRVGAWIDNNWDHGMLLSCEDPIRKLWTQNQMWVKVDHANMPDDIILDQALTDAPLYGMKFFIMEGNPTAENIAAHLKAIANELLKDTDIRVHRVVCHETTNCSAIASD